VLGAGDGPESRAGGGRLRYLPRFGTIDISNPDKPQVKPELDFFRLGQASKFLQAGAVRIASDEPAETTLKDVAFRNPNGTVVLYALNAGKAAQGFRIWIQGQDGGYHAACGAR